MTERCGKLPRRVPGAPFPAPVADTSPVRFGGAARIPEPHGWADDAGTLVRLLRALRAA